MAKDQKAAKVRLTEGYILGHTNAKFTPEQVKAEVKEIWEKEVNAAPITTISENLVLLLKGARQAYADDRDQDRDLASAWLYRLFTSNKRAGRPIRRSVCQISN